MKVMAFNGSPRKNGNTARLIRTVLKELEREGIDTEVVQVGAAVVAVRRTGGLHAFDSMNHFFTISQMIIPGSSYWNIGIGRERGDVDKDEEGLRTMKTLGQNMSWLLKKVCAKE